MMFSRMVLVLPGVMAILAACQTAPAQEISAPTMIAEALPAVQRVPGKRLAIATAYAPEMAAMKPLLNHPVEYRIDGVSFYTGEMGGQDVVLFKTGVSLVNATMNTQRLLDHFDVTEIIVSGVAGGLDPELSIGDVTVPRRWAQYNESVYMRETAPGEYTTFPGVAPVLPAFEFIGPREVRIASADDPDPARQVWFDADPTLLEVAQRAALRAELKQCDDAGLCLPATPEVIVGGSGVTGSIFMDNARFRDYLHETFDAQVAEMETAAIAMVAHSNNVPFLAFRSLSDLAGGGHAQQNEIEAFEHLAAINSAALVLAFLTEYGATDMHAQAAEPSAPYCELNFEGITGHAEGRFSPARIATLEALQADPEATGPFQDSLKSLAVQIASVATDGAVSADEADVLSVWGGYKGVIRTSLAMRLPGNTDEDRARAVRVGAALGYVFVQESVLVQCAPLDQDAASMASFELVETETGTTLSPETLPSVFGMMLGQARGYFDLGFTYYPDEDRFSTLGFSEGGDLERDIVGAVYDDLQVLTDAETSLSLSEIPVWLSNPTNDWDASPDGAGYVASLAPDTTREELAALRAAYGLAIDQWSVPASE